MLEVILVGTGGTVPTKDRRLTGLLVRHDGRELLIDCGEGMQVGIKACGLTLGRIDTILLTHFHADHVAGLPGLLLSMGNEGRTEPVSIAGPEGCAHVVESLRVIAPELPFQIRYTEWKQPVVTVPFAALSVTAFAVAHRVPCYGYRIRLARPGKFDPALAEKNGVPLAAWNAIQKHGQVTLDGVTYTGEMVMGQARRGLCVTYVTDTRPLPLIAEMAKDADLFVCEGMFADPDKQARAEESGHMTFSEAATLAAAAQPRRFWLTHYSAALPDPEAHLDVARSIFAGAECGFDGKRELIRFSD